MNIGLDLRFIQKGDIYSNFIFKVIQLIIKDNNLINYNIYVDIGFAHINLGTNTKNKVVKDIPGSIKEQTSFNKILKKDKNDIVIFFNYKKPIVYKKRYIIFIPDLLNFHFPSDKNIFEKYFENIILNSSLKYAHKIICFNEITKTELNDKFNISEEQIKILKPFYNKKAINNSCIINIDTNTKYNISGDYFIYNAGSGNNKNLERLIEVFANFKKQNINLNLLILDNDSVKDVNIRKKIIELDASSVIYFIGDVGDIEKEILYKNSKGTIYPVLYDTFPFLLEEAINYETRIIASDIINIKNTFKDHINYFSATNSFDMYEKILNFSKTKKKPNYKEIFNEYNMVDCSNSLINIIKSI